MSGTDYILIDSTHYLDYFVCELKDKYTPITLDTYAASFLGSKNIDTIGILDYLSDDEVRAIISVTSSRVDAFIAGVDERNRALYGQIFGRDDVALLGATMKYLFKRFVIATIKFLKGLQAIVEQKHIINLAYLHDGFAIPLCGNRFQNAFFFPDDIAWMILQAWNHEAKPRLAFVRAPRRNTDADAQGARDGKLIQKLKAPLRRARKLLRSSPRYLYGYRPRKQTLLLLAPLYDMSFLTCSAKAHREYNIVNWEVDDGSAPQLPPRLPRRSGLRDGSRCGPMGSPPWTELVDRFDLHCPTATKAGAIAGFEFESFVMPLVRRFLDRKLPDICRCWNAADELHNTVHIDAVLWGNPPHRYPGGIVKEFFRLNDVPIVGMQHGGAYGSNDMRSTIFDLDFGHCDYYFSYGYDTQAMKDAYPDKPLPEIIPVGSTRISDFVRQFESRKTAKSQVKVMWPLGLFLDNFFYQYEYINPGLFRFQKQIIDALAALDEPDIVLKFPVRSYARHYLRPYIEGSYPGAFQIIDDISVTEWLKRYEAGTILIEAQATPLNEAVAASSTIVVYEDPFMPLTKDGARALSPRAVICHTKDDFLAAIADSVHGRLPAPAMANTTYLEKYCVYTRNPRERILDSIRSIVKHETLQ